MCAKIRGPEFKDFLQRFPAMELPVTLTDQTVEVFSKNNQPLHPLMIETFILPYQETEPDEFTEFVPCFRIPETHDFQAIIVWKGALMRYEYILMTFDKQGQIMGHAVIGGMMSDGKKIVQSVSTIEKDWMIHIVEGEQSVVRGSYDPKTSRAYQMELLPTGEVVFSLTDDDLLQP